MAFACVVQLCVGCGASSHTNDDGGTEDGPAPPADAHDAVDAGSSDASADSGSDGSAPRTCAAFDASIPSAPACSEYELGATELSLEAVGFAIPSRSERGWQWVAHPRAIPGEYRVVEAGPGLDEILGMHRLEWLPLTIDGDSFLPIANAGALWPTCNRWFLLLGSPTASHRTLGAVVGADGGLVAAPLDLSPMRVGNSAVATSVEGDTVTVAAARRVLDDAGCRADMTVARVSSDGALSLRPVRSEIPEASPVGLFWDRDRWALVSRSCPATDAWTLSYLTPDGVVLETHVLAMDARAILGRTRWVRGADDTVVAVFATDGGRTLTLQEVDLRSRDVSSARSFLTTDVGWEISLPFTYAAVEPAQGYAMITLVTTPSGAQETWLIRTSPTGSLHSKTVLYRGPPVAPSAWITWLGSSFAAYFGDGDREAVRQVVCVR